MHGGAALTIVVGGTAHPIGGWGVPLALGVPALIALYFLYMARACGRPHERGGRAGDARHRVRSPRPDPAPPRWDRGPHPSLDRGGARGGRDRHHGVLPRSACSISWPWSAAASCFQRCSWRRRRSSPCSLPGRYSARCHPGWASRASLSPSRGRSSPCVESTTLATSRPSETG